MYDTLNRGPVYRTAPGRIPSDHPAVQTSAICGDDETLPMPTARERAAAVTTARQTPAGAMALAVFLTSTALAQTQTNPPAENPDAAAAASDLAAPRRQAPTFTITGAGSFTDSADLDTAGELQISRVRAAIEVALDLGDNRSLTIGVGSERSWYDFENATTLDASGDPFGDVTDSEFFLRYAAPINARTSWFALGAVGLAAEDDADLSESLIYSGALGFRTARSDTFSWGLGVLVRSQLDDDPLVVPLPQIRWAISDRWTLESQRAGLRLGYAHSEDLSYGLQAEYISRTFRLDEDGPIPDGIATDRRVPVSFFAAYRPTPAVSLVANIGASVYSNIELLDRNGDDLTDDDADAALYFSLSARISF